jgi:two-component system sensor histidine kinase QseC
VSSLRRFLLISVLSALVLINFIAALQGYRSSMKEVEALFDQKLHEMAQQLAAIPLLDNSELPAAEDQQMLFQIANLNGVLLWRSAHAPKILISVDEGYGEHNINGFRWRTLVYTQENKHRRVIVAERVDIRYQLAESVILESIIPVLIVLPIVGLLIWLIIGHGLKSLGELARILQRKAADDFGTIQLKEAPSELMPVVNSVNALLSRLNASFERERRFSADAAHELRTPISAIKIHLHNLSEELPSHMDSLQSLDKDVNRLAHLVEQMLLLHRTTPDHYPAKFESISLQLLAREVIAERYADFAKKDQNIELLGDAIEVNGDRFALGILLQNLLHNASKYTQRGGSIRVLLEASSQWLRLTVEDNGPGISAEVRERVFERFYRLDGDRHQSGVIGCGLGLSIVEHIAELHHARITMASGANQCGLAISVDFPTSQNNSWSKKANEYSVRSKK